MFQEVEGRSSVPVCIEDWTLAIQNAFSGFELKIVKKYLAMNNQLEKSDSFLGGHVCGCARLAAKLNAPRILEVGDLLTFADFIRLRICLDWIGSVSMQACEEFCLRNKSMRKAPYSVACLGFAAELGLVELQVECAGSVLVEYMNGSTDARQKLLDKMLSDGRTDKQVLFVLAASISSAFEEEIRARSGSSYRHQPLTLDKAKEIITPYKHLFK